MRYGGIQTKYGLAHSAQNVGLHSAIQSLDYMYVPFVTIDQWYVAQLLEPFILY